MNGRRRKYLWAEFFKLVTLLKLPLSKYNWRGFKRNYTRGRELQTGLSHRR